MDGRPKNDLKDGLRNGIKEELGRVKNEGTNGRTKDGLNNERIKQELNN